MKELILITKQSDSDSNQIGIRLDPSLTTSLAMQLVGTLALHILNSSLKTVSKTINDPNRLNQNHQKSTALERKAAIQGVKDSLYDAADNIFSTVLATFDPDAPKNSIDEEAILTLTNKEIERRYALLSDKEKQTYTAHYQALRASLLKDIKHEREQSTKPDLSNQSGEGTESGSTSK